MRLLISAAVVGAVLGSTLISPVQAETPVASPQVEAVDVDTAMVPAVSEAEAVQAERADPEAADLVAELPARRTDSYGMVGVTWKRGFDTTGLVVSVRLRTGGTWADWTELEVESEPEQGGRDGTDPLWVGDADGVAVRVTSPTGERPTGLRVSTIDPGTLASDTSTATNAFYAQTGSTDAVATADGSPTITPKPGIISRSSWGARANSYCDSPRTGNESRGVIVHHTAGTNSYSKSQSKSIVRAVQAYHMKARDWCDIGYNFLVDKYGQIFEGRNGGVDRPVRGAHAGKKSVNTYTMGVSMMGDYSSREPSGAQKSAMVKLIGWRVGTTFHPATGTYTIGSLRLHRIAGHRNVVGTACPGSRGYRWLGRSGGLRSRVKAYVADYSSPIKTKFRQLTTKVTGPVYIGEYATSNVRKARLRYLDLYHSTKGGTRVVSGYFRTGYNDLRAQAGVLGEPRSDAGSTTSADVTVQRFARGSIYRVRRDGHAAPYAIWGAVDDKYRELDEEAGSLGAPTQRLTKGSGGASRAYFEKGRITLESDGTVVVTIY